MFKRTFSKVNKIIFFEGVSPALIFPQRRM